jgi:hypothetical protein
MSRIVIVMQRISKVKIGYHAEFHVMGFGYSMALKLTQKWKLAFALVGEQCC